MPVRKRGRHAASVSRTYPDGRLAQNRSPWSAVRNRSLGRSMRAVSMSLVVLMAAVVVVLSVGTGSALAGGTVLCPPYGLDDAATVSADAAGGGTVSINGTCIGHVFISSNVTLQSGAHRGVLDGNHGGTTLGIAAGLVVTVQNLTIRNGGPGILVVGDGTTIFPGTTLNLVKSLVTANTGNGVIATNGATVNVTDSRVTGNTTSGGGGGIYADHNVLVDMTGTTVSGNSASIGGGIYVNEGDVNATTSTIDHNTAAYSGGGISSSYSRVTLTSTYLGRNTASDSGGGVSFSEGGSALTNAPSIGGMSGAGVGLFSNRFSWSGQGKAADAFPGPGLNLVNSIVDHNTASSGSGGGILNFTCNMNSAVTLTGSTVAFNNAGGSGLGVSSGGGGGYAQYSLPCRGVTASLLATASNFVGNTAKDSAGGAILNVSGFGSPALVTLAHSGVSPVRIWTNQARWGGGVFNYGDAASVSLQAGTQVLQDRASVTGGGLLNDCGATSLIFPGALLLLNTPNNLFTNLGACILPLVF